MTELARRVWGALPRVGTAPEAAAPRLPAQPVRVGIRLPRELDAAGATDLASQLDRQVVALLVELGLDRPVSVTAQRARPDARVATVSIDERPVAHVRCDGLGAQLAVEPLCQEVMSRILRRLPLLIGSASDAVSSAAYLTSLGCRVPGDATLDAVDVEIAEELIDARTEEEIVLEIAAQSLRRVERAGQRAMIEFRETEYRKRGVVYPDMRLVLTDLPPGSVRLRLNDVTLPLTQLDEDAGWTEVVHHVGEELTARRHWFVRMTDVSRVLDADLVYVFPDLVAVTEANYSRPQLTAFMRELVRSGRRMRNFPRIMWMLLDQGGSRAGEDALRLSESPLLPKSRHRPRPERDPMVLATRVRKMAAEEAWRLGNYQAPQNAVRLSAEIEKQLVGGRGRSRAGAEWAAVRALATAPTSERVVTRTIEAIGPVRDAVQAVERVPRVMASQELPPDVDLAAMPVLTDPEEEV